MAKFIVPTNPGTCTIVKGRTGLWTVSNGRRGHDAIFIACKTRTEADRLCERLNTGDHPGEIEVPKHTYHRRTD